jgi:O-acetyl-ADP-ribose deacetylase (regulator of RNase III)
LIRYMRGDLLASDAEALVNAVNTVGVMGKGIALRFKQTFPENFRAYAAACARGEVRTGRIFVTERNALYPPRWIVNFPTKEHWKNPTRIEWIESGLHDLCAAIRNNAIRSIAIPALGCGNGGLDWAIVRPLIEAALNEIEDVDIRVYEPT